MAWTGDQLYQYGFRHDDFAKVDLAAHLFPYERLIRVGPAYFAMRRGIADQAARSVMLRALAQDPWALDVKIALQQMRLEASGVRDIE